jgi:hypothetical protein
VIFHFSTRALILYTSAALAPKAFHSVNMRVASELISDGDFHLIASNISGSHLFCLNRVLTTSSSDFILPLTDILSTFLSAEAEILSSDTKSGIS